MQESNLIAHNIANLVTYDESAAELCKRKFSFFVKTFWHIVVAEDLVWEPHMEVLCNEIQVAYERVFLRNKKAYDLVINVPPGTSKSTIVTIMAPAWSWVRDASLRHITGSYSGSLATEHSVKSRDIVESDLYRLYFPDVELKHDKGQKTNYETTKLGQRYATSVGGSVTGVHGHILTIDDPLNPKQAVSKAALEEANNWMDKTLSMRKVNKEISLTILIMQRLATNDPTGHMLDKGRTNVKHICLPGEISNDVKPAEYKMIYKDGLLSPKRLSRDSLAESKINLGSAGYAGQIQQRPVQEGGLIWKKWFIEIDDVLFPSQKAMQFVGTDWDLAYTDDDDNAGSAYITAGKINNKMFIDDVGAVYFEFPELLKFMKNTKAPHYIEAQASGKSAKQTLVKNGIPAIEVEVSGGDKVARARFSSPYPEAGLVYIRKSVADFLYNDSRQGILNFPKGSHKDVADALSQAIQRIFRGGMKVGGPRRSILDELDFD